MREQDGGSLAVVRRWGFAEVGHECAVALELGIATALKEAQIEWAIPAGLERQVTTNDERTRRCVGSTLASATSRDRERSSAALRSRT